MLLFFGIPNIAKFATFLSDFKGNSQAPDARDTTPPPPPKFDALPEATKDSSLEVNGTSEPGSKVVLTLNNRNEEILVDKDGHFTTKLRLIKGENTFQGYTKDASGNESSKTPVYKINYDTDPPFLEIVKPENGASYYGSKQRQVVVEGKSEEGAQVQVNERIVVVYPDSSFSYGTTLNEGENTFTIKAQDKAGNLTEKSLKVNFIP